MIKEKLNFFNINDAEKIWCKKDEAFLLKNIVPT